MLRTRLFLNLMPFVVILLAIGIYAIALFSRLAETLDTTVADNYRSLIAAQDMSLALSRMERDAWAAVTRADNGGDELAGERQKFDANLAVQLKSGSLPGERELNQELVAGYAAFQSALNHYRSVTDVKQRRELHQQSIVPAVLQIDSLLQRIRALNQQAILSNSQHIEKLTRRVVRLMSIGMVIALIISAYSCYRFSRSILRPILSLTEATRALGEGNYDHPVPVVSRDELGDLARAFNKMAARLQEYRQSTTEKIMQLHRTMETTLASFPDPIFVLDRAGHIELQNPSAQNLAGSLACGPQLPERLKAIAQTALATGKDFLPHSFEAVVCYRVGNSDKYFLPRVLAMTDKENVPLGVAVVLYDVTRFRLLDAAKTNLVATVSHELKTPLTSVRMALHLLTEQSYGPLTPRQEELLHTAREDAERLLQILLDLLDLARLEEGRAELRRENVSPADLLETVQQEMSEALTGRGLRLHCAFEPNLPSVFVDRQRIRHVFSNLIENAVKHSPPGAEIQLGAAALNGEGVQFTVTDRGPGVPEEYQARIFDRFFRVPGQSKTGAGLGLSIAREITVAHGGRIGVRSQPGHGSTFYVVLKPQASPA